MKRFSRIGGATASVAALAALFAGPALAQQPTQRPAQQSAKPSPLARAGQTPPAATPQPAPSPRGTPQSLLPTPKPSLQPSPRTVPQTAQDVPPAQITPAIPYPRLSPAQAAQLTTMLREGPAAQGLRAAGAAVTVPTDNDRLIRAALDYARAVHSGRLAADDFQADWGLHPEPYDPLPAFAAAVGQDRLSAWMVSLAPPYAGYEGLRHGLAAYRAIAANGGWTQLAAGPDLKAGDSGPRVAALRARLAIEDNQVRATGDSFDADLKAAVIRAQRRYGLNPSGLVSKQTLAALNVPVADRIHQIMANMERWRWLPEQLPTHRIQVNIAAAVLTVFEGDNPVMSMRAVTGKPGHETPMLESKIHSIVLNPPWNVPSGIAAKELFPKGPAYLAKHGFRVIGTGPDRRLQQRAGDQSALGRYKFDFNNPYAVYLHDTPAQASFGRYDRLESHGCVRLEKPADLARLLLRDDPEWQPSEIQAVVDKGDTTRVQLPEQISVYLLYWTAFAGSDGAMNFRGDPYGWDETLAAKIDARSQAQALAAR